MFTKLRATVLGAALALAGATGAVAQTTETALLAGGCFWCIESDFHRVQGVTDIRVGFAGGTEIDPSYDDVARGRTSHLEVAEITYDPAQVSYAQILHMFMRSVDPLDAGGQFCDRGRHYTTAIFVADAEQRAAAETALRAASAELGQEVVTPILDDAPFYPAEEYHQDYARKSSLILTRFGPRRKSEAYQLYRNSCGRDARVLELWGEAAPFASH